MRKGWRTTKTPATELSTRVRTADTASCGSSEQEAMLTIDVSTVASMVWKAPT